MFWLGPDGGRTSAQERVLGSRPWVTGKSACDTPRARRASKRPDPESGSGGRSNAASTVIVLKNTPNVRASDEGGGLVGVLLTSGWASKSTIRVGRAGFVRCLPNGSWREVVMDEHKLLRPAAQRQDRDLIIFGKHREGHSASRPQFERLGPEKGMTSCREAILPRHGSLGNLQLLPRL